MHAYDPLTPLEETLRTLDQFIRAGKIRYWGLSNFTGWQLTKAVHLARALNVAGPVTLQPQYSLLAREIEWEIVPAAIDAGMGLLPWSPLGGGWLSGKYRRDQRPAGATRLGEDPDRGMEAYDRRGTDRTWHVIDAVQKIAEDRGVSMAEVALAWVTARPAVSSTILGARTVSQLEANLRAADLHLTAGRDRRARRRQRPAPHRLSLWRAGRRPASPHPARPATEHRRRARPADQDDEPADVPVWMNTQHSRASRQDPGADPAAGPRQLPGLTPSERVITRLHRHGRRPGPPGLCAQGWAAGRDQGG